MSVKAIIELRPAQTEFTLSKTGKSASLLCEYSGRYNCRNIAKIELLITAQTAFGRPVKLLCNELSAHIKSGGLLSVTGQIEHICYQEREGGKEVDKLRLVAYSVEPSVETAPINGIAMLRGYVKPPVNNAIFSEKDGVNRARFTVVSEPSGGYDKETFLAVIATAFGHTASRAASMKIKAGSRVVVSGRMEASGYQGMLAMTAYDLRFAAIKKNQEE